MYARMDFDPADVGESEFYGVDFVYDLAALAPNEQLVSATFNLTVFSGVDASPAARLDGAPVVMINPANGTGLVTMAVQRLTGLLLGVVYSLQAVAVTTNGNTISLWSRVAVGAPPSNIVWSH